MGSGVVWQPEDVIALLAWLDFCVKHGLPFDESIENHLINARATSKRVGTSITKQQAKQKLVDTGRKYRQFDALSGPTRETLDRMGSICIPGLPEDMQEAVKTVLEDYEQCYSGLIPSFPNENPSTSRRKVRSSVSETPMPMPKSTNLSSSKELRKRTRCETASRPTAEASTSRQPTNAATRRHKTTLNMEDEIRNIRADWQRESYVLAQQQGKSAQVIAELRAQLKHRDMAEKACQGAGRNPLEETLYQHMHQNWTLIQKVKDMRKQIAFCQQTPIQSEINIQQCMNETMSVVESELENILNGHEPDPPLQLRPSIQHESDLGCLVRSMFASSGDEISLFTRSLVKFGSEPEVIVRALASAAMREWVFMSNFPDFGVANCPLLNAYRKVVLTHDGWNCARNLEVAAFQSLMDEPNYKAVELPRKASELAARFSRALAPLFSTSDYDQTVSWGQRPEVAESRKFRLIGIFSAALNLKAQTVMTDKAFEYVVYPPGKLQVVEIEDSFGSMGVAAGHRSLDKVSDMMMYGSINMYRTAPWIESDSAGDANINARNFIARDSRDRTSDCLHNVKVQISRNESQIYRDDSESQTGPTGRELSTPLSIQKSISKRKLPRVQQTTEIVESTEDVDVPRENESKVQSTDARKTCGICLKIFSTEDSQARHEKNDTCGCCSECGAVLSSTAEFVRHRKEKHQNGLPISFETARTADRKHLSFQHTFPQPQDDQKDSLGPGMQYTPETTDRGVQSDRHYPEQDIHQSDEFESSLSSPETEDEADPWGGRTQHDEDASQVDNPSTDNPDTSGDELGSTQGQTTIRRQMKPVGMSVLPASSGSLPTEGRKLPANSYNERDNAHNAHNINDDNQQVDVFDPRPPKKKRKASNGPVMYSGTSSVSVEITASKGW